jgi:hypothetical protein
LVRLLDAPDFLATRGFRFRRELEYEPAQGFVQAVGEGFIVEAERLGRRRGIRGWRIDRSLDGDDGGIRIRNWCLCGHSFLAIEIEVGNEWKN